MTHQEFLAWEQASRDTIDVKRCYVDLAGELVAGILLSQIVYWHLPSKKGEDKLRVVKDGVTWLAKAREDWWEECRITPRQFDRACTLLEGLGLIVTDVKRFNGSPVKHIRICWEVFLRDLTMQAMKIKGAKEAECKMDITKSVTSKCPKRQDRIRPIVKIDIDIKPSSLTETPLSQNTQRINQRVAPAGAPKADKIFSLSLSQIAEKEQEQKKPAPVPEKPEPEVVSATMLAFRRARREMVGPEFIRKHGRPSNEQDWMVRAWEIVAEAAAAEKGAGVI